MTCIAPVLESPAAVRPPKKILRRRGPVVLDRDELFVVDACARAFGVAPEMLGRRGTGPRALQARTACYRLLVRSLHLSLTRAGAVLNRDHTTVMHGVETGFARHAWCPLFLARFDAANAEVSRELAVPLASVPDASCRRVEPLPEKAVVQIVPAAPARNPFAGLRFEDHPRSRGRRFSVAGRRAPAADIRQAAP